MCSCWLSYQLAVCNDVKMNGLHSAGGETVICSVPRHTMRSPTHTPPHPHTLPTHPHTHSYTTSHWTGSHTSTAPPLPPSSRKPAGHPVAPRVPPTRYSTTHSKSTSFPPPHSIPSFLSSPTPSCMYLVEYCLNEISFQGLTHRSKAVGREQETAHITAGHTVTAPQTAQHQMCSKTPNMAGSPGLHM